MTQESTAQKPSEFSMKNHDSVHHSTLTIALALVYFAVSERKYSKKQVDL